MSETDLETLLSDQGLVTKGQFGEALKAAETHGMHLAQAIVQCGFISEDALADTLARAVGTVVIDVDRGTLESDSVRLIPEGEARRHLAIPVARGPANQLRVAFANPLDQEPYRLIEEITEMSIDPLVATVSGINAVLDREWRGRTTEIMEPARVRSELPPESTRQLSIEEKERRKKLDSLPGTETGAVAIHTMNQRGTPEQRIEALLLTLVEKGLLTRADYVDTLTRLIGRSDDDL